MRPMPWEIEVTRDKYLTKEIIDFMKKQKERNEKLPQQEISDEEIEEGADEYYPCDELDDGLKGMIISAKKGAWFDAIKWYREQLKNKENGNNI